VCFKWFFDEKLAFLGENHSIFEEMTLKQLFYGIGIMVILYSCRTEKIEVCENEETLYKIDLAAPVIELQTLCCSSDSSSLNLASSYIGDYFLSKTDISSGTNCSLSSHFPFRIKNDKDYFKCNYVYYFKPYCGLSNSTQILVNSKNDIYLEDSKLSIDSIQNSVLKELSEEPLGYPYNFRVEWDERASLDVIFKTLKATESAMKSYFELRPQHLFKKPICELDSSELLELNPDQFCFSFENSPPPPPPPEIRELQKELDLLLN